jgi:NTP pyrophosphatase (non-canonical NTP hydrolase)
MIEKITTTLTKLDVHFRDTNEGMTESERVFSRVVKLNEEVGELCEAILSEKDKNQRVKEKVTDVDAELADVLICTLLLAQDRDKNIWDEVNSKLEKISKKFNL